MARYSFIVKRNSKVLAGVALVLGLALTQTASAADAATFLKWSMDRYATFKSFRATCLWTADYGEADPNPDRREIYFVKPNKFKVVSVNGDGRFVMTSVSNGKTLAEYTSAPDLATMSYTAPKSIATAGSMQMQHPMFCGSLLYKFFGGSASFDGLVNADKGKITFGPNEKAPNGELARVVKFYAVGSYGNTQVLIGKETGRVYRISYDSAGLHEFSGRTVTSITTEKYKNINTNALISEKTFVVDIPKNRTVTNAGASDRAAAPVPVGQKAPDFEVTSASGQKLKLSSLKGHVVLVDFWATWCPPCVKGLPITDKMHRLYASKGLKVITISGEARKTVMDFVAKQGYKFPVYLEKNQASEAYKVEAIPTLVIVDAKGRLSSYSVGLESEDEILRRLRKAGLKI